MSVRQFLFDEDRGVSPVIGVILMVAITVILAAVIATFVMNMGPETNSPANAQWDGQFDIVAGDNHDSFKLAHEGGSAAPASEYVLSVTGTIDNATEDSAEFNLEDVWSESGDLTASDSVTLDKDNFTPDGDDWGTGTDEAGTLDLSGATVELIWEDPEGDQTQIVEEWEP